MEDAKIASLDIDSDTSLFGVFDGHGGKEVAEFVTRHFGRELLQNHNFRSGNIADALKEVYLYMDQLLETDEGKKELFRIARDLPPDYPVNNEDVNCMAGCTAVVALIKGNKLYVANAGDSRCVLCRGGNAVEMTKDHKPDLPEEKQRIEKAGGVVEDGRVMGNLNLSRSIGDMEYKKTQGVGPEEQMITAYPDLLEQELGEQDEFILLACDGVWDMMTWQQVVDFVKQRKGTEPSKILENLLDNCLAQDVGSSGGLGCDNMTAILVEFTHPLT